jgi:type VI secretion system protein VasJ
VSLEVVRQAQAILVAPISSEAPAGEDARHDPLHAAIRAEVGKLESLHPEGVDWAMVQECGEELLRTKAKDLLIASHVACARYERFGLDGIVSGVALLTDLMDAHWEAMFPPVHRVRARANAIAWLLERVGRTLGETAVDGSDHARVAALVEAVRRFSEVVGARFGDDAPAVRSLASSVERLRLSLPEPVLENAPAAPPVVTSPLSPGPASPGPASPGPASPGPASPGPASPGPASPGPASPSPDSVGTSPADERPVDVTSPSPSASAPPSGSPNDSLEARLGARVASWSSLIEGPEPGGVDARYDPDHEWIRNEVGQLEQPSGGTVDWEQVEALGVALLAGKSKDLLIAAYVTYAMCEQRGVAGLAEGLWGIADIQERFWEGMHPPVRRLRARANALAWMLARLETRLLSTTLAASDGDAISALERSVERFMRVTRDKLGEEAPGMRPLQESVARLRLSLPAAGSASSPGAPSSGATPASASATLPTSGASAPSTSAAFAPSGARVEMPAAPAAQLADAAQVTQFLRDIGQSLVQAGLMLRRANPADPTAYRLTRLGLYLPIATAPMAEQGARTTLPGPGPQLVTQLETLAANQKWAALLDEADSAIPRFRFWLDLQRYVALALAGLGEDHVKAKDEVIEAATGLVRRFPALVDLELADGLPFASSATKDWLVSLAPAGGAEASASDGTAVSRTSAVIAEARTLAAAGRGAEAVERLHEAVASTSNGRDQFLVRLAMAAACSAAGKGETARAIYATLLEDADARQLYDWEPELLSELLIGYHRCLKALTQTGRPVADEAAMVYRRLSRVNPRAALELGV